MSNKAKPTTLAERRQAIRKLDVEATRWWRRLTRAHNALVAINRKRKALTGRPRKPKLPKPTVEDYIARQVERAEASL